MRLVLHNNPALAKSGSAAIWLAGLILCACVPIVSAAGTLAEAQSNAATMDVPFAIADFDGDRLPDLAVVQSANSRNAETRYSIQFELSSGARQSIGITAPAGGLQLASRDVNGDNFADVVVSTALLHRPVAVLLNDGHGKFALQDAEVFPEAFWTAELSWTAAVLQIYDAALNLPARSSSGDADESAAVFSPGETRGTLGFVVCRGPALSVAIEVLGRSPPL